MTRDRFVDTVFADRLHDEAMTLLFATRDWAMKRAPIDRALTNTVERLCVAVEAMRLTALVTDAVAWTLAQKAVAAGELDEDELAASRWAPVELSAGDVDVALLPPRLASLLDTAERLHRRVTHLYARRRDELDRRRSAD